MILFGTYVYTFIRLLSDEMCKVYSRKLVAYSVAVAAERFRKSRVPAAVKRKTRNSKLRKRS